MKKTEKIIIISTAICLLVVIAFGFSYAFFEYTATGEDNSFNVSCYQVSYDTDPEQNFTLTNTYPMTDSTGASKSQPAYKLTMKNNCTKSVSYSIRMETLSESTLPASDIRFSIGDNGTAKELTSSSTSSKLASSTTAAYILKEGSLSRGSSETIVIHAWIKQNVTGDQNKTFQGKVTVQLSN